jgi:hypothetical protein
MEEEPLAAARGIFHGLAFGGALWAMLFVVVWACL